MSPIQFWQNMSDEGKLVAKQIGLAAIGLYVLMQLLGFLIPILLIGAFGYWLYKIFFDPNPKILK